MKSKIIYRRTLVCSCAIIKPVVQRCVCVVCTQRPVSFSYLWFGPSREARLDSGRTTVHDNRLIEHCCSCCRSLVLFAAHGCFRTETSGTKTKRVFCRREDRMRVLMTRKKGTMNPKIKKNEKKRMYRKKRTSSFFWRTFSKKKRTVLATFKKKEDGFFAKTS